MTKVGFQIIDHVAGTAATLFLAQRHEGEVHQLRTGKQVCSTIRAGGNASTAADAGSVVQRVLGSLMVDVHGIRIRSGTSIHGDVTALLHHVIQGRAVHDHVLDDRVGSGAEWLQLNRVTIGEIEQTLLAGRGVLARAVRAAIDGQATGATDALTAVGSKGEGLFATLNVALIDVVQQLQDCLLYTSDAADE